MVSSRSVGPPCLGAQMTLHVSVQYSNLVFEHGPVDRAHLTSRILNSPNPNVIESRRLVWFIMFLHHHRRCPKSEQHQKTDSNLFVSKAEAFSRSTGALLESGWRVQHHLVVKSRWFKKFQHVGSHCSLRVAGVQSMVSLPLTSWEIITRALGISKLMWV